MATSDERPLAELLNALAERSPAPGAGCATAWAGALAAALLEMTAAFADDAAALARSHELRTLLLDCGEQELHSYEPVLAAVRLERTDPTRPERLAEALSEASETPLAMARAAAEVAELAAGVAARSKRAVSGDAVAGVLLAEAASQAAVKLVELNLHGRGDDPRLAETRRLSARAVAARARVIAS
jgi:formiminotetrahydrofolate cyclodeaminase